MEAIINVISSGYYAEDRTIYILSNGDKLVVWNDGELDSLFGDLPFQDYEEILINYGVTLKP
jgi:hypothetical protein